MSGMIWLGVFILLAISFIFSGVEAGVLSLDRVRLRQRVKSGDAAARKLEAMLREPERMLVTVVLVTNLMNISAIALAAGECERLAGRWGLLVEFAVALPLYLLVLEVAPKTLFRSFPFRTLSALAEPLRLAEALLAPMHGLGHAIKQAMAKRRAGQPPQKLFAAREDFKYLTSVGERTGTLGKMEREMIHHVVDFRAAKVAEVMLPFAEVGTIPASASVEELLERRKLAPYDRWPLAGLDGKIEGIVDLPEIALSPAGPAPGASLAQFQRRVLRAPAEEPAFTVLRKLRAARASVAVVQDAEERPLGVVFLEDLVRRMVEGQRSQPPH